MKKLAALLAAPLIVSATDPVAIHVNQLGYLPAGPKRAVVASPSRAPLAWRLLDARGRTAAQGRTTVAGDDAASGDHVHLADFGGVRAPGEYRLSVGGVATRPFPIRPDVYRSLARASLNFFYQQRAGTPIEAAHAGGAQWARAAGHPNEVAACFSGPDQRGTVWPGCLYKLDVTGGWYDAGDHGKYVVNGGISLWTLLNLHEVAASFPDGSAALPEAGNGVPDLLDEARWEMEFLLRMQVPDGTRLALPVGPQDQQKPLRLTPVHAGGMAHHKIADRNWTALPTIPAEDREERLLYPPSTAATLNLAAVAAQCARIWRSIDPAFAARCLSAAQRAWTAALRNPEVYAAQGFTGSGGYGDWDLSDEFHWAAAELYATTGAPAYLDRLRRSPLFTAPLESEPSWPEVAALGTITLATAPGVPDAVTKSQRALLVAAADRFLAERDRSGYRIPYATTRYPWGSNSNVLNRAMILLLAHRFTGDTRYRAGAIDAADYVLGRNPLDQSYVSGFGWNPLRNPHHRFWAPSLDPKLPGPPPGVLSGGPNNTAWADDVARSMQGKCAPQRCWRDDVNGFAMNEVAINWNAPLVWVAAYLDATAR
ncbi:glycoside hydrolase family 9 protein [Sphingomonas lenta]|uniref:Endoglucanase n=1 Tax=Sphingomonas lenta TaxID=1141887 RepID=A0A2A2SC21_9SPHN|nr:glycoside hydrolase family 9 protein [Sphingomonas lenta]PAX06740.1 glycosyl hydrolase [Sphingomonas lenta]